MRRDWDYVTMEDYQRDMEDTAKTATNIITQMREDNENLKHLLILAVRKYGPLKLPRGDDTRNVALELRNCLEDMTIEVRIK